MISLTDVTSTIDKVTSASTNIKDYIRPNIKYFAIGAAAAVVISKRLRNYAIIAISGKLIYDIIMNFSNINQQSQQIQQASSKSSQSLTVVQPLTAT